jgi:hypothetical protein
MTNATINNRSFTITTIEQIEGALAADFIARGWEPAFYHLSGKRGSVIVAMRSIKTGNFSPL